VNEEKAKELYERFLQLQQHTSELEHHFQGMQEQLRSIAQTKEALAQLQALTEPTQTWIPIAPGAYVKGTVDPASSVLLHLGSSAAVEKAPESVIATLDEHQKVLEELSEGAVQELKSAHDELEQIKKQVAEDN
jgi:prefoldin alpha subunit